MGLEDGKLRIFILPLPSKPMSMLDPFKIGGECTLPNKVRCCRYVSVWNEDRLEWQVLQCSEKLYNALEEARAELKRKSCREPIIILKGTNVRVGEQG